MRQTPWSRKAMPSLFIISASQQSVNMTYARLRHCSNPYLSCVSCQSQPHSLPTYYRGAKPLRGCPLLICGIASAMQEDAKMVKDHPYTDSEPYIDGWWEAGEGRRDGNRPICCAFLYPLQVSRLESGTVDISHNIRARSPCRELYWS
jgi:hypothetical protein